jgi:hypothetical protein
MLLPQSLIHAKIRGLSRGHPCDHVRSKLSMLATLCCTPATLPVVDSRPPVHGVACVPRRRGARSRGTPGRRGRRRHGPKLGVSGGALSCGRQGRGESHWAQGQGLLIWPAVNKQGWDTRRSMTCTYGARIYLLLLNLSIFKCAGGSH